MSCFQQALICGTDEWIFVLGTNHFTPYINRYHRTKGTVGIYKIANVRKFQQQISDFLYNLITQCQEIDYYLIFPFSEWNWEIFQFFYQTPEFCCDYIQIDNFTEFFTIHVVKILYDSGPRWEFGGKFIWRAKEVTNR